MDVRVDLDGLFPARYSLYLRNSNDAQKEIWNQKDIRVDERGFSIANSFQNTVYFFIIYYKHIIVPIYLKLIGCFLGWVPSRCVRCVAKRPILYPQTRWSQSSQPKNLRKSICDIAMRFPLSYLSGSRQYTTAGHNLCLNQATGISTILVELRGGLLRAGCSEHKICSTIRYSWGAFSQISTY